MVNLFLKAKHWQLFILFFALPFIAYVVMMSMIFSAAFSRELGPDFFLSFLWVIPVIIILFVGGLYGWFWSIGVGLQQWVPPTVKLNVTFFKVCLLFPLFYILTIVAVVAAAINSAVTGFEPSPFIALFIIPAHLFSIFCSFYGLYFVAKTVKTAELQREVNFSDYVGEFFMIWFYPIGVWIVQPKINKIIAGEIDFAKDFGKPDPALEN